MIEQSNEHAALLLAEILFKHSSTFHIEAYDQAVNGNQVALKRIREEWNFTTNIVH